MKALVMLALVLLFPIPARAEDAPRPKRLTVADVITGLSLTEVNFDYVDEPPGKLQALECQVALRDTKARVRIRIEIVYTLDLFSDARKWDAKAVRAAEVRQVTITPTGTSRR